MTEPSQRGAMGIVLVVLAFILILGGVVWYATRTVKQNPDSTDVVTPNPQEVQQGVGGANQLKSTQTKALNQSSQSN